MPPLKYFRESRMNRFKPARLKTSKEGSGSLRSFLAAWADDPRQVGAIAPSSPRLAEAMASFVDDRDRLVVELGAGTGPVTEALLARGIEPHRLVAVEQSERLAAKLKARFPQLSIIQGDAGNMRHYLGDHVGRVGAVVSSLPLRSLPSAVVAQIVQEIDHVLAPDGVVIQFTYDPRAGRRFDHAFERYDRRWVWNNIPPARVDVFRRHSAA